MSKTSILYLDFPRYGLCNKIITWAKAFIWCKENNAELLVNSWVHLPLGSILRREKSKRWYKDLFKNESVPLYQKLRFFKAPFISSIDEPKPVGKRFFKFKSTPLISDLPALSCYREEILEEFYNMIEDIHLKKLNQIEKPVVGIHIRRGDFITNGSVVDLSYYIQIINDLRRINGNNIKVTIFSDGFESELTSILDLPGVSLFQSVNDLVDLLALASSKVLVTTKGSSYSYWAAFMNEGVVLHHPKTWVQQCRPESINEKYFEGKFPESEKWPELLVKNIKAI